MKLIGSIFEEEYGPLSRSETVNGVVRPTCIICQPVSANTGNTLSRLCEPATLNVTDSCSEVTLQRPAEVSKSSAHNASDSSTQPAVLNQSFPLKPSELVSSVSNQSSDTARDWSAGMLVTDCSGKSVQVSAVCFKECICCMCKCEHV